MTNFFRSRLLLLVMFGALAWVFLFYSHDLVRRLEENNRTANETIAWFWAGTQIPFTLILEDKRIAVCGGCGTTLHSAPVHGSFVRYCSVCDSVTTWHAVDRWTPEERARIIDRTRDLFSRLVDRLGYTTILTDRDMTPQIVDGMPVNPPFEESDLSNWRDMIRKLDELNPPVPLVGVSGDSIGWLHYGVDSLDPELRIVPFVELGMLIAIAFVLLFGIRAELRREKEMAWVGFARETAHQLGTPISSLMGWVEILRQRVELPGDTELEEAVSCMSADLERLNQIVMRYGEMGKKPRLVPGDVNQVVSSAVSYFRERAGLLSPGIRIETVLEARSMVLVNPVLMSWVLENLIRNSLAALADNPSGQVTISTQDVAEGGGRVEILISDNGKGIRFGNQSRIFEPGFSTRRGGWGLGLTLSRRIIVEYHGGSIRLVASSPGKGTTFGIMLPVAETVGDAEQDDRPMGG